MIPTMPAKSSLIGEEEPHERRDQGPRGGHDGPVDDERGQADHRARDQEHEGDALRGAHPQRVEPGRAHARAAAGRSRPQRRR